MKLKISLYLLILFVFPKVLGQQLDKVDFTQIAASIEIDATKEKVEGKLACTFNILKASDSIYLDAKNMSIMGIESGQYKVTSEEKKIWLRGGFKKGTTHTVIFYFEAFPQQTLYFTGNQIWTQGQGKYTSHWLPSIDDMNDKIEFDLQILAPKDKIVTANGKLEELTAFDDRNAWRFNMEKPMSSYLVGFTIGNYKMQHLTSDTGVPIEIYYNPADSLKVESTYRYTKKIFDFLEKEIDVPYPWQNYKQVPVRDFLYAGMENTTMTLFSEAFVVDSIGFNDRNYVNVNAHELAHQWFGNLVTETDSTHHWLHEGFATYYSLRAERKLFGEDYYYWKMFQSAEQLKAMSDEGKGESLLNPKASSLTFYEKGAWALYILKEQIGEEAFRTAVKNYLEKNRFKNVDTNSFLAEARIASGQDLKQFEEDWLQQSAFKAEQAYNALIKSDFIHSYLRVSSLRTKPLKEKFIALKFELTLPNDYLGQEAIYQIVDEPISETLPLYRKGFKMNNLYVRQAIALTLETIPKELQADYESLLNDTSYVTQEAALYNLWAQFPEKRAIYLDKMEDVYGFQNKNIRQLWLVLASVDENYRLQQKPEFISELKNYSNAQYSFEIRELAFGYITELQLWDEVTIANLVNASVHHTWRFRNYARKLLAEVLKNEIYKDSIVNNLNSFSEKERDYLITQITSE